jgi:probable F420-dependent oxidoreductase
MRDAAAIREFGQTLDREGFDFVNTSGHLLSSEPGSVPDRPVPTYGGPFYDPFVLFSHLAAVTDRIHFRTSILILPLFPTAVVAKQAAELSLLSDGRFEMGIAVSWNEAEYAAMNADIHTRGRRLDEQLEVLKRLWTEPFVTFEGRWHKYDRVGLNALPASPIPIWIGCSPEPRFLRRVARHGDGWLPYGAGWEKDVPLLQQELVAAGRNPEGFPIMGRLSAAEGGPEDWAAIAAQQQAAGITDILITGSPAQAPVEALPEIIRARDAVARALGD